MNLLSMSHINREAADANTEVCTRELIHTIKIGISGHSARGTDVNKIPEPDLLIALSSSFDTNPGGYTISILNFSLNPSSEYLSGHTRGGAFPNGRARISSSYPSYPYSTLS